VPRIAETSPISLEIQVPEHLHAGVQDYLESHPGWDADRFYTAAISLYLLQNPTSSGRSQRMVSRTYLDTLFKREIT
jgi:Protein of unknown function (DUF2811)